MKKLYVIAVATVDFKGALGPSNWQKGMFVRTRTPSEDGYIQKGFEASTPRWDGGGNQFWTTHAEAQALIDEHGPHTWGVTFEVIEFVRKQATDERKA